MIYTVTFNPALDYVVKVNHFTLGKVNRTVQENIFCGGKGINVSALLANLGYESVALGFVARFTGQEIERGVGRLGFRSDFIRVERGMSRINVKLKSCLLYTSDIRDNYPKYVLRTDAFAGGNYEGIKTRHIADFLLSDEY